MRQEIGLYQEPQRLLSRIYVTIQRRDLGSLSTLFIPFQLALDRGDPVSISPTLGNRTSAKISGTHLVAVTP